MNSAQSHFLFSVLTIVIGLVTSMVCGVAIAQDRAGFLHIFGTWFGGFIIAAALFDFMHSLRDVTDEAEVTA